MHKVYLSIGSNYEPETNLHTGISLLRNHVQVETISPVYETVPIGKTQSPSYLNAAVLIQTDLDPIALKADVLRPIEARLGRSRAPEYQHIVPIDLDIVLFDNLVQEVGNQQIPEPDIENYAYIAVPLAEIAPDYQHPVNGKTIAEIAGPFRGTQAIIRRRDITFD
jgi:2-amino-4-hydroxy-6-hydroxymethyldihydropteridine diphosphokinase